MSEQVRIVEVGARDGLQNQPVAVSTADKVRLIEMLVDAGITHIEAGAFVSPKWIPMMADSAQVLAQLNLKPGVTYSVLTPNVKGMEAALASPANEVAVFVAASESFSQRNTNCSIDVAFERAAPVLNMAREAGIRVRGYISCVLGCPYEGDDIDPGMVADMTARLLDMGCFEVSLGDTIGRGTPAKAKRLIETVSLQADTSKLAAHFHNTYGQAIANLYAVLEAGVRVIDSSVAGLGGCPYAQGATGNVATEDVLYLLDGLGMNTGIDMEKMLDAAAFIQEVTGAPVASNTASALLKKRLVS
ncbi:MAG: hydroxymethylglutaryl-CoA lyase [Pseudomonadales bacterium]|nr:hydroxymethylglutaryl-CoA lyase [Pseudomonadales bacterium]